MIRDYIRGEDEDLTLQKLAFQADGSFQAMQLDGRLLKNGFTTLVLYTDSGGASPIPGGVGGGNYEYGAADTQWTADESGFSGLTVYAELKVTNATYQGIDLWADFKNFGTYTSNDANFDQLGGSETITATATLVVPEGHTRYRFNFDSTAGDIAPTMPNGAFDGQQAILKDTGAANMTRIKGPGFYLGADSGGMYLKSRSILVTWNSTDSVWEMDDSVVAEWVSGDYLILASSIGIISQSANKIKNNGTAVNQSFSYPITFDVLYNYQLSGFEIGGGFGTLVYSVDVTVSGYDVMVLSVAAGTQNSLTRQFYITTKGKY